MMNKSYSVYFPNTDIVQEILAETWDIDNDLLLTFYQIRSMENKRIVVAVFNMNNILGFKENDITEVLEDETN